MTGLNSDWGAYGDSTPTATGFSSDDLMQLVQMMFSSKAQPQSGGAAPAASAPAASGGFTGASAIGSGIQSGVSNLGKGAGILGL